MRWRNSLGQRIRLATGNRMNSVSCCCDGSYYDPCPTPEDPLFIEYIGGPNSIKRTYYTDVLRRPATHQFVVNSSLFIKPTATVNYPCHVRIEVEVGPRYVECPISVVGMEWKACLCDYRVRYGSYYWYYETCLFNTPAPDDDTSIRDCNPFASGSDSVFEFDLPVASGKVCAVVMWLLLSDGTRVRGYCNQFTCPMDTCPECAPACLTVDVMGLGLLWNSVQVVYQQPSPITFPPYWRVLETLESESYKLECDGEGGLRKYDASPRYTYLIQFDASFANTSVTLTEGYYDDCIYYGTKEFKNLAMLSSIWNPSTESWEPYWRTDGIGTLRVRVGRSPRGTGTTKWKAFVSFAVNFPGGIYHRIHCDLESDEIQESECPDAGPYPSLSLVEGYYYDPENSSDELLNYRHPLLGCSLKPNSGIITNVQKPGAMVALQDPRIPSWVRHTITYPNGDFVVFDNLPDCQNASGSGCNSYLCEGVTNYVKEKHDLMYWGTPWPENSSAEYTVETCIAAQITGGIFHGEDCPPPENWEAEPPEPIPPPIVYCDCHNTSIALNVLELEETQDPEEICEYDERCVYGSKFYRVHAEAYIAGEECGNIPEIDFFSVVEGRAQNAAWVTVCSETVAIIEDNGRFVYVLYGVYQVCNKWRGGCLDDVAPRLLVTTTNGCRKEHELPCFEVETLECCEGEETDIEITGGPAYCNPSLNIGQCDYLYNNGPEYCGDYWFINWVRYCWQVDIKLNPRLTLTDIQKAFCCLDPEITIQPVMIAGGGTIHDCPEDLLFTGIDDCTVRVSGSFFWCKPVPVASYTEIGVMITVAFAGGGNVPKPGPDELSYVGCGKSEYISIIQGGTPP